MVVLVYVVVALALCVLAIWFGHHGLRNPGPSSGGNALGGFDVFDPARARMKEDLDSKETEGSVFPSPGDDERPVRVDLQGGKVHIRKPPTTAG